MSGEQFESKKEWRIFELFEVAIILKGINGVIELVLGTTLLFFTNTVNTLIFALIQNELIDDPNDFFAIHARSFLASHPGTELFGGVYLLAHGIVKVVLVAGMLRKKIWAYPAAIAILSLFICYQVIRIVMYGSITLTLLTAFDMVVVWLIGHEYHRLMREKPRA